MGKITATLRVSFAPAPPFVATPREEGVIFSFSLRFPQSRRLLGYVQALARYEVLEQGLDPVAKKIRNLNKKYKAIEELKERVQKGDKLEATQLKKIDGEADIRKELKTLGAPA